jgi:hypothetical protein
MVTIGAGDTIMLWGDVWNGHHTLTEFPRLYSYAKTTKILVAQYLNNLDVHHNFHTPISPEVASRAHNPKHDYPRSTGEPAQQRYMDIYLGYITIFIQQVLHSQLCIHCGPCSFQMDMKVQSLQKNQNLYLASL